MIQYLSKKKISTYLGYCPIFKISIGLKTGFISTVFQTFKVNLILKKGGALLFLMYIIINILMKYIYTHIDMYIHTPEINRNSSNIEGN